MRPLILPLLLSLTLSACNQPSPDQTASTPANETAAVPAQTTEAAPAPAEAVVAKAPEGDCGDQSALAAEDRLANTPQWSHGYALR